MCTILYPYMGRNTYYEYEYSIFTIRIYLYMFMCRDMTKIDSLAKYEYIET
jgi:hypothetical protein